MRTFGAEGKIFDLIRHIYREVHAMVKDGKDLSKLFKNEMGVLQGDPLSGLLWIIFLADLDLEYTDDENKKLLTQFILMADDIALVGQTKKELQGLLQRLSTYCSDNLLRISIKKTVTMEAKFSSISVQANQAGQDQDSILLHINGKALDAVQSAKYIGLCFESMGPLKYKKHLSALARAGAQAGQKLLEVNRIANREMNVVELIQFYNVNVRSRMLFGSEITIAADSKRLSTTEITFLRRALELSDSSTPEAIYLELDFYPIDMIRNEKALKFFFYASSTIAPELLRAALRDNMSIKQAATVRNITWTDSIKKIAREYNIEIETEIPYDGILRARNDSDIDSAAGLRKELEFHMAQISKSMRKTKKEKMREIARNLSSLQILFEPEARDRVQRYLITLPHRRRVLMTRLRLGGLKLGHERGKWAQIVPKGRRICRLCETNEIEDILHILGACCGSIEIVNARYDFIGELSQLPDKTGLDKAASLTEYEKDLSRWRQCWHSQDNDVLALFGKYLQLCMRTVRKKKVRYMSATVWNERLEQTVIRNE